MAQHKQSVTIARDAGLRIVAGSDAGSPLTPHASLQDELLALEAAGLSAAETIRAATSDAAVSLGIGNHVGSLMPGFTADMILLDSNPLDDLNVLKTPCRVWKLGLEVMIHHPSVS